jgi:ribosomal protein L37E
MREQAGSDVRRRDEWVHVCDRCGQRMDERQCKIVCANCGFARDCSDP